MLWAKGKYYLIYSVEQVAPSRQVTVLPMFYVCERMCRKRAINYLRNFRLFFGEGAGIYLNTILNKVSYMNKKLKPFKLIRKP